MGKHGLPARLEQKIEIQSNNCWYWTAYIGSDGYGRVRWNQKHGCLAHRVVYEILVGPIPENLESDHLCRIRHCVNPEHIELITHVENVNRGNAGKLNKQKTHCPRGHPYSGDNLYITSIGGRVCKICQYVTSMKSKVRV